MRLKYQVSITLCALTLSLLPWNSKLAYAEDEKSGFLHQDTLTGTWGGARQTLVDKGVNFEFIYTADVMGNVAGGIQKRASYLDNWDMSVTFDLEKLVHWKGATLFAYGVGNMGRSPVTATGDMQGVSNIDAPDSIRLEELWLEQNLFNNIVSLKAGKMDVNAEFDTTETGAFFINISHGMGIDFSQSGQNGASAFPATSVGGRIKIAPKPWIYVQSAILDGVPDNPTHPGHTSFKFGNGDGLLIANEIGFLPGELKEDARYGKVAVGGWVYTAKFDDLVDVDGIGDPIKRTAWGLYGLAEYQVYREGEDQGLNAYARFGYATPSIHQTKWYLGTGLVYTGLIPTRDEDQLGFGVATAINGSKYKTSVGGADSAEVNLELSYRAQLTPWLALQPDFQYIINPGTTPGVSNAFNLGARVEVVF